VTVSIVKRVSLVLMAAFYVVAGSAHFVNPEFYVEIMPPWVPWHRPVVFWSGVAEIALGVLLLPRATRHAAAWGVIALLIAVFPANLHQAINQVHPAHAPAWMGTPTPAALWLRLPFQALFALWAWWHTHD
jgi:uncharacterized membrane protein